MINDVCLKDRVSHELSLRNEPTAFSARVRVSVSRFTFSAALRMPPIRR